MDSSPAPEERARLNPVNPLTIAVAVVLLAAGGAFGWRLKTDVPSARPTPEAAAAALALERVDARTMCGDESLGSLRERALEGPSSSETVGLPERLPKRSPIPGYEKVSVHAVDPARAADYELGAVDGHVVSFRPPEGEGGFDVYAFRYVTRKAAADAVAANVARRVCGFGAVPLAARGRPGMVVLEELGGQWSSAWWVTQSDVIVVKYGGWGEPDKDLANLAAIAGATALF